MKSCEEIEIEQRPEIEACTVRGVLYEGKGAKDPAKKKRKLNVVPQLIQSNSSCIAAHSGSSDEEEEEHREVVTVLFTPKECRVWK